MSSSFTISIYSCLPSLLPCWVFQFQVYMLVSCFGWIFLG
uniref:Uncharacterized protein n=1 Tax=Rhizophora mucronata TaxID=61149 RepID=A0A2P2N4M9_RHIMU